MDIRAIILDIDGTLAKSDHTISNRTKQKLELAQKKGIKVVLASGRPTPGMHYYSKTLGLEHHQGLIASYNGACITDCTSDTVIYENTVEPELAQKFLKHCEDFDVIPMVVKGEYLLVNDAYPKDVNINGTYGNIIKNEARVCNLKVMEVDLKTYVDFPVYKILISGDPDELIEMYDALKEPVEDDMTVAFSSPFFIEFTSKGVNKAFALDSVLHKYGIDQSQTIAFGDSHNDLALIQYANIGVAMGNAVDEVKKSADLITLTNNEDGIAHILDQYINELP
ncbi:hypothetical protein AOC36_01445 [Erysipelothrix larvae]|uniref:Haloacid dehalogenase n=1 Tax=Erysipelothrix larvae TaxID=1514105 RepID=A0A0X8GYC8_9FIRM|nr:Cof-type HAD-IIB family hydrolase [Erysipelothrix larvae]AMC92697.1 hypothetical protein AOC36_01445 [Erysipelothrix larvae]